MDGGMCLKHGRHAGDLCVQCDNDEHSRELWRKRDELTDLRALRDAVAKHVYMIHDLPIVATADETPREVYDSWDAVEAALSKCKGGE